MKKFNEHKSERAEKTEIIRTILDKLSVNMLKNNAYDNREKILQTVIELIKLPIDWEKDGTRRLRETYEILMNAIPVHIKKHEKL